MELDIKKILAHNVKNLRELKNLSQADFAEIIGLQVQAVSQIENAKSYPNVETIFNICSKFNISPANLFSLSDCFSKEKFISKQEIIDNINLSLQELDKEKLEFVMDFIGLVLKKQK